MGASGRVLVLFLLLGQTTLAEPDAAIAPAGRWSDPRGTAAGGMRSAARPLVGEIEEAWSLTLPGPAAHTPLHWDGLIHLLCGSRGKRTLCVIDLYAGEIVRKKTIPEGGPSVRPVLWNGVLVFDNDHKQLVGYRGTRKKISRVWKTRAGAFFHPVAVDGEVYVLNGTAVEKRRIGRNLAAWRFDGKFRGRPAVYGEAVYAIGTKEMPGYRPFVYLYAIHRKRGDLLAASKIGQFIKPDDMHALEWKDGQITVTEDAVYVETPRPIATVRGRATHAVVERTFRVGKLFLAGDAKLFSYEVTPSAHATGAICRYRDGEEQLWGRWTEKGIIGIASGDWHPELFRRKLPAVVLGDIVYFGSWAADIRTGEVVWRLHDVKVTFPPVPADELVLVVDDRRTLRAYRQAGTK